jgi:hypothetical protein
MRRGTAIAVRWTAGDHLELRLGGATVDLALDEAACLIQPAVLLRALRSPTRWIRLSDGRPRPWMRVLKTLSGRASTVIPI